MYTVYFIFFQVASATATRFGLSRGLLGLQYDQINESESESIILIAFRSCFISSIHTTQWYSFGSFDFPQISSEASVCLVFPEMYYLKSVDSIFQFFWCGSTVRCCRGIHLQHMH